MTFSYRWRDAVTATKWLAGRETCGEILRLLALLPLVDVAVLQQLFGLRGGASVYRSVSRLTEARLVAAIQPPVYRSHSPRLLYLTDLGLTTLSLIQGVEPAHLARRLRLRGADLLRLVPSLPDLLATYELLGALANSRPGRPRLLAWERPWRRSYLHPMRKTPASVALPAWAALSWDDGAGSYLLLPDRGIVPPRLYRAPLNHLVSLRRFHTGDLPVLIVATTSRERVRAWGALLHEVTRAHREAPLPAHISRWHDLPRDLRCIRLSDRVEQGRGSSHLVRLPPLRGRQSTSRLPASVGDSLRPSDVQEPNALLGQIALSVTPADHDLLELVGLHPFLRPRQLADVLGWEVAGVRRRMNRLTVLGLMRRLTADEITVAEAAELMELTETGLELVSARLGLSLTVAVHELGLTGGGPDHPYGPRRKLLRNLAHTREADEIFVCFYRLARQQAALGSDDAMEEWQNAAACSRRYLRPDGYGVYRRRGLSYGFFLEFDRGTMNARDHFKKLTAYYRYGTSGRFERDYHGYPTILIITANNASEERIAQVARSVAVGQPGKLPLLLTCRWRIDNPSNTDGLLGPVWRQPDGAFDDRQGWLPASGERQG